MGTEKRLKKYECWDCGKPFRYHRKRRRCDACLKTHLSAQSLASMRKVRAKAAFRDKEREGTRERMRKRRARLHRKGLNNHGQPYSSKGFAKMAKRMSRECMGQGIGATAASRRECVAVRC